MIGMIYEFEYQYTFYTDEYGSDWHHEIIIVQVHEITEDEDYPEGIQDRAREMADEIADEMLDYRGDYDYESELIDAR